MSVPKSLKMWGRVADSKKSIIEGLQLLPDHHHRDPSTERECATCRAKKSFKDAYIRLPSEQMIKAALDDET